MTAPHDFGESPVRTVRRKLVGGATTVVVIGSVLAASSGPAAAAPAAPTGLVVSASSPNSATSVVVTGTAEAGSTVTLYTTVYDLDHPCGGGPVATGTAADFASTGIVVQVFANVTTYIAATATDGAMAVSDCSSPASYTNIPPSPPGPPPTLDTTLTRTPPAKVRTSRAKAKVTFEFSSNSSSAQFECHLDGDSFAPCVSGRRFAVKVGRHVFTVRATLGQGAEDRTPATYAFKVKRKPRH